MKFIEPKLEEYCIEKSSAPSDDCDKIQKYTLKEEHWSQMLTGKMEASFIGFLLRIIKAKRVLEFGTYTGYSALAMAENLPTDGEVVTIEIDKRIQAVAQGFWDKSQHGKKITSLLTTGLEAFEQIQGNFDFVFIDADKVNYMSYFKFSLERLNQGGIIAVDNVLWSGKVITDDDEKSTIAIRELNDYIASRNDIYKTLTPIRDGIFLIQKI